MSRALVLSALASMAVAGGTDPAQEVGSPPPVDRGACESEAVLLARPIDIRSEDGRAIQLQAGDGVYLCGPPVDGWQPLMFPEQDEPIDCSFRSSATMCPVGWTLTPFEVQTLG